MTAAAGPGRADQLLPVQKAALGVLQSITHLRSDELWRELMDSLTAFLRPRQLQQVRPPAPPPAPLPPCPPLSTALPAPLRGAVPPQPAGAEATMLRDGRPTVWQGSWECVRGSSRQRCSSTGPVDRGDAGRPCAAHLRDLGHHGGGGGDRGGALLGPAAGAHAGGAAAGAAAAGGRVHGRPPHRTQGAFVARRRRSLPGKPARADRRPPPPPPPLPAVPAPAPPCLRFARSRFNHQAAP